MFKNLHLSSPVFQMLTSNMPVLDPKKQEKILCFWHSAELYGGCLGKWLLVLLNSTFFITKTFDFIISFALHLVYQDAYYITSVLSIMRNHFISHCSSLRKVK